MNRDRLVVCPECDELVVEDEWHIHKRECRPRRLYEMGEHEILDYLAGCERRDPDWQTTLLRREEAIQTACERYDSDEGRSAMLSVPYWEPRQMFWSRGCVPENARYEPQRDYLSVKEIRVRIPNLGLPRVVVHALIREQIEQQWKDYTDV